MLPSFINLKIIIKPKSFGHIQHFGISTLFSSPFVGGGVKILGFHVDKWKNVQELKEKTS